MVEFTQDSGFMANSMDRVRIRMQMDMFAKVYGLMESAPCGSTVYSESYM